MRIWRAAEGELRLAAGPDPGWRPRPPAGPGPVTTPGGPVHLEPIPELADLWLETPERAGAAAGPAARLLGAVLQGERQRAFLAEELASRYEEIELLYTISEILGQTTRLDEAAQTIVREVSTVVGARRASIMVYDEAGGVLRTVAARGFSSDSVAPVPLDDERSIAARVFRERKPAVHEPAGDVAAAPRGYQGQAYLSVPICYAAPGGKVRCVGVINLTDRIGGDRFTPGDRKLVSAVANQIGAAVENARLVLRDLAQQRLRRELELAHDLQLKLLPHPSVLGGDAHAAARCKPADSVGGDFYSFTRLGRGRVGVMAGDVASHGFSAALIMALVMSAAGIHAAASSAPDETLRALLESLETELRTTEMYFSVFYGVLDPSAGRLTYASAGHPYAFRMPERGEPERLEATSPPLGLAPPEGIARREVPWSAGDLLCLWTDGLVDARNAAGERFGERRLLDIIGSRRTDPPEEILRVAFAEVEAFSERPTDDRTLVLVRL